eukprot:scaffold77124_cov31-Tisochrysis_lutea.AAC.2
MPLDILNTMTNITQHMSNRDYVKVRTALWPLRALCAPLGAYLTPSRHSLPYRHTTHTFCAPSAMRHGQWVSPGPGYMSGKADSTSEKQRCALAH